MPGSIGDGTVQAGPDQEHPRTAKQVELRREDPRLQFILPCLPQNSEQHVTAYDRAVFWRRKDFPGN